MTVRGPSLLLAPLCALVFAACGAAQDSAEDFQGPQRDVVQAVEDLQDAGTDLDEGEICSALVTERLRTAIQSAQGRPCPEGLEDFLTDADEFELTVDEGDVRIDGTTAVVQVTSGSGDDEREDQLTFVRDGRTWRLDSLGG